MRKLNLTQYILIALIVLIILVTIVGTILYFTTDMLKSKESLFQKYISQNIGKVFDMMDFEAEEKYFKTLQESDYYAKTSGVVKYLETQNDEEEIYSLDGLGVITNSEGKSYTKLDASYGEENLITLESLKRDDKIGIRLPYLVDKFISIQNKNLGYIASSLGLDEQNVSENLKKVDLSNLITFSNEEIKSLKDTYYNIIFSNVNKKNYSSKSAIITLSNNQSPDTKAYSLKITQSDLDIILKKIINQAKQDQIILSKIGNIDAKIVEAGFVEQPGESLKERYLAYLDNLYSKLEYKGEDNREIVFTVYQSNKKTVRTEMKKYDSEVIYMDLDDTNGNGIIIRHFEVNNEGTQEKAYYLRKQLSDGKVERELSYVDLTKKASIQTELADTSNGINITTKASYSDNEIYNIGVDVVTETDNTNIQEMNKKFNTKNSIILNNYDTQQIKEIFNIIKDKAVNSVKVSQSNIHTKLLTKIINWLDEKESEIESDEEEKIKQAIAEFNSKFELYEGENVEYSNVQLLLDSVSTNFKELKTKDGKVIIYIKQNSKNEAQMEKLKSIITNRNKYNVKLNYDNNGLINSIELSIYEKNQ